MSFSWALHSGLNMRLEEVLARLVLGAEHHVVHHGHPAQRLGELEGADHAGLRDAGGARSCRGWRRRRTSARPCRAEVGRSKPVIRLKNVVLPAPLGPISAVMMPRCTSRWSTSTAVMPPNCRTMLSTTRIGSGLPARAGRRPRPSAPCRAAGSARSAVAHAWCQTLNRSSLLLPRMPCGRKITSSIRATPTTM